MTNIKLYHSNNGGQHSFIRNVKHINRKHANINAEIVRTSCIASEQHRGHIFEEITNIYKIKKESIKKDREKLENLITPQYKGIALDLEIQLANLDGGYENLQMKCLG